MLGALLFYPEGEEGIQEEIASFVTIQDISRIKRLKSLLDGGCWSESELFADTLGIDFRCAAERDGLQCCALPCRKLFPEKLIVSGLSSDQTFYNGLHIRYIELSLIS